MPAYSRVEYIDITTWANRYAVVNKSFTTTLSANSNNSTNTITVTEETNFAVGDYVNIATSSGAVQNNKVSAVNGNTITLTNNLTANVTSGANVCVYSF